MNMEDKINKQLLDDLKNLPKVSAPADFEDGLWKKIYSEDERMQTFWQKIFSSTKFIPATATLAGVIIIFFLINSNANDYEDPFMIEPPVRDDIITISNEDSGLGELIEQKQKTEQQEWKSQTQTRQQKKANGSFQMNDSSQENDVARGKGIKEYTGSEPVIINDETKTQSIKKEELNFLQKSVSEQEKQQILELKRKIKVSESAEGKD